VVDNARWGGEQKGGNFKVGGELDPPKKGIPWDSWDGPYKASLELHTTQKKETEGFKPSGGERKKKKAVTQKILR